MCHDLVSRLLFPCALGSQWLFTLVLNGCLQVLVEPADQETTQFQNTTIWSDLCTLSRFSFSFALPMSTTCLRYYTSTRPVIKGTLHYTTMHYYILCLTGLHETHLTAPTSTEVRGVALWASGVSRDCVLRTGWGAHTCTCTALHTLCGHIQPATIHLPLFPHDMPELRKPEPTATWNWGSSGPLTHTQHPSLPLP